MQEYLTFDEFVKEMRSVWGDSTCDLPKDYLLAWTNTGLRRLAREKGLGRLFRYQDTFELSRMNEDGTPAASWTISASVGMIIDITSLMFLDSSDCRINANELCYVPLQWFRRSYPFPEKEMPGDPCHFTVNQMGPDTKLIFDRPITKPHMVDMIYEAFHPRLKNTTDIIRIPYSYLDILGQITQILMHQEGADFATARALYEDYDYLVSQARELLAKQPDGLPLRRIRRSF